VGAGLVLLSALLLLEVTGRGRRYRWWAELVGRHSLFVFMLQFSVYFGALGVLRLRPGAWWPLLFAATVVVLLASTRAWDAAGGKRFIGLGVAAGLRGRGRGPDA
jgi:hypothetical protein